MKRSLITISLFFLLPILTFAVTVSNLYDAELPVISQDSEVRARAIEQGFIQVLSKVSGDTQIKKSLILKVGQQKAMDYLEEYSYVPNPSAATPYLLNMHFDSRAIQRLLKRASIHFWGEHRPLILVWLVAPNRLGAMDMVSSETTGSTLTEMQSQAKRYGIPVIFPMLDMTDMSQVTAADVLSGTLPVLEKVSKRYAPDAYLIGDIHLDGAMFRSQWQLILSDNQWEWTLVDKSTSDIIANIMAHINRTLSQYFQPPPASTPLLWLTLQVSNVAQPSDLRQLVQYLKQLTLVQRVRLMEINGSIVKLEILIRGTVSAFQKNVIGQHLMPTSSEMADHELAYEWVH
jgi:hypothetical protein